MSTPTLSKVPAGAAGGAGDGDAPSKKSRKKLVLVVVPLVVVLAAAGAWFFLLRGGGEEAHGAEAAKEEEHKPEKGDVVRMDPISINLADGHYLKLGIALQVVAEPSGGHGIDGAEAVDLAIATFSGREIAEVSTPEARAELKEALLKKAEEAYHHDVMDIYFTDFVTQ